MKFKKGGEKNLNNTEALPEKEKRLAREIEKLPADILERVTLMLLWRAKKPSAKLTYIFKSWGAGDPEPDLSPARKLTRVSEFNQLLGFAGISAVVEKEKRREPSFETSPDKKEIEIPGMESQTFYLAGDLETAEKISKELEQEKLEIDETIKAEIQKMSPTLYSEMMEKIKSE